jgi:hypothetical protein
MGRYWKLPHPYNWIFYGMVLGALIAALTTGQSRLPLYLLCAIGAIAGAAAASFWKKRQRGHGG